LLKKTLFCSTLGVFCKHVKNTAQDSPQNRDRTWRNARTRHETCGHFLTSMVREMILTRSAIEAAVNKGKCDGINKAQCILVGIEFPPRKGWKDSLVGNEITDERYQMFLSLRGRKGGENYRLYQDIVGKPKRKKRKTKRNKEGQDLDTNCQTSSKSYYETPLWLRIRELVFIERGKTCWLCSRSAVVVHHQDYSESTMRGDDRSKLYPLCKECHREVHFTSEGVKCVKWRERFSFMEIRDRRKDATEQAEIKRCKRYQEILRLQRENYTK